MIGAEQGDRVGRPVLASSDDEGWDARVVQRVLNALLSYWPGTREPLGAIVVGAGAVSRIVSQITTADSRRLAVELPADPQTMTHLDEGGRPMCWMLVPDRQAICRSDDHSVMGIFGPGYIRHQYPEWLLTAVADLLDDDLAISSAGLLRGGAIAWVEVSMPDTITTPEGVAFRPNLTR